jgi:hypothetical protein
MCDDYLYNPPGFARHFRTHQVSLELLTTRHENSEVAETLGN